MFFMYSSSYCIAEHHAALVLCIICDLCDRLLSDPFVAERAHSLLFVEVLRVAGCFYN
jgi:hypothetical protein